ncbi:FG-GAP-like repeat-containing protein [Streptomyces sp. BR1]|uniref:FG-GAP-like repeat-containing protein n=1 Tax=Streptomyces sp. BR1 TaxID=1592323 RepID=UPI00402BEFD1
MVPVSASASPQVRAAAAADSPSDSGLPEEDRALASAQASGQPAEVVSARTESSDEWANPDGTFSVKRYGSPIRVFRDGTWVPTDPTLVFAADGSVVPKASTVSVVFSGGGKGPLLSGVRDGRTLTLGWPTELPKPTLAENVATYAEVLPGVDMQLKAEVDGFSQLLVVKTAEAAKNPALETVKYSLQAAGLSVSKDADTGVISAVDPAGQAVFSSPPPVMWDSTTLSSDGGQVKSGLTAPALASGSGFDQPAGAKNSLMPVSLSGSTLSIVPDQTLLGASDTKYPVYIDPLWSGSSYSERQHWTRVYKKWPTNSYYDAKDVARVGFEHETDGVSRSFFQMDTAKLKGAKVVKSTFRIKNVWSWSCQARPVQLWETGPISRKTNWNNQPGRIGSEPLKTVDDAKGWSSTSCPAGNLEFDVTPKMKTVADQGRASITLGLSATAEDEKGDQPEEDTFSWKKFDPKSAVLETLFNRVPDAPDKLGTFPYTSCEAGSAVGNTHVSLYARVKQPDAGPLHARFTVTKTGESKPLLQKTVDATNWSVATLPVADADLPTGDYTWNVTATDNQGASSSASKTCKFSVDRTRPSKPPVINSVMFPDGKDGRPATTGRARDEGCFTFDPNGVNDVDSIWWWSDTDASQHKATLGACENGKISARIKPPGEGPHFVYAYSVDAAGNQSDPTSYLYYANTRGERDQPGDLNGDGNNDIWSVDSNGTLLTYAGQNNGQFSAASSGGKAFTGAQITYRGGWRQNSATDLVSLEYSEAEKKKKLWTYANDGNGTLTQTGLGTAAVGTALTVDCPEADDMTCFTSDDHWKDADQVVAPGDMNNDSWPDLLVQEGDLLYLYYGDRNQHLSSPLAVGGAGWKNYTVIAPGDTNGDGLPDLWLRDKTNGDLYVSYGQGIKDAQSGKMTLDLSKWGSLDAQYSAKIGSGYTTAKYPTLSSIGDVTGDKVSDLWARQADNTMVGWAGKTDGTKVTGFGSSFVIDGSTGGIRIPAGTVITDGQSFKSRSAKLAFTGNRLVITSNAGKTLWASPAGDAGSKAVMQADGVLAVQNSGGQVVWKAAADTDNGYALLQDRGNLVLYDFAGHAKWSSGTALQHDYDGDGRDDLADWYDFGDGHDGMHTFLSSSDGTLTAPPLASYTSPTGNWNASNMKFATGDYNGDGRADMAALYGYSDGSVKLFTALGKADGGFEAPTASWGSGPGNWAFGNMTMRSGDFNGDGRDDLVVWYSYGNGSDQLFTFTADIRGGFNAPLASQYAAPGNYNVNNMKFTVGDFNGDGRSDLGVLYGYSDNHVQLHSFLAREDGGFQDRTSSWEATNFQFARTHIVAGDFNGDGKDDIAAWYDQADGGDAIHTFVSNATSGGKFDNPKVGWQAPPGNYYYPNMKIVAGDFDGDGKDDIAAMYGYDNGAVKMFTWRSNGNGFSDPQPGWSTAPGNWTFDRVHLFNNYN